MHLKTYRVLSVAIAAMILGACTGGPQYQPINVRNVVAVPEVRIRKTFYSDDRTDAGVEFGVSRTSAKGDLTGLYAGSVRLGDSILSNPRSLRSHYDLSMVDVSLQMHQFSGLLPVGYELSAGLAYARLNMAVTSPTGVSAADTISAPAFRLGIGGIWRVATGTTIHGDLTGLLTKKDSFDSLAGFQASLAQSLGPHLTLQGGYSYWMVDSSRPSSSAIELRYHGPLIRLGLNF